jgi:hypothetical protein
MKHICENCGRVEFSDQPLSICPQCSALTEGTELEDSTDYKFKFVGLVNKLCKIHYRYRDFPEVAQNLQYAIDKALENVPEGVREKCRKGVGQ